MNYRYAQDPGNDGEINEAKASVMSSVDSKTKLDDAC